MLVKREPTVTRAGPLRFQERVYPDLYRVNRVISASTFNVEPVVDPGGLRSTSPLTRIVWLGLTCQKFLWIRVSLGRSKF